MTDANREPQDRLNTDESSADEYSDFELDEGTVDDDSNAVPAAGGTFGIDGNSPGYGEDDVENRPAAEPRSMDAVQGAAPVETVDEVVREGNRQVPASGGTFGVTHDESGYEDAPGRPSAGPNDVSKFGVPPQARSGFDGYAPGAEGREFAEPQFGAESTVETSNTLPIVTAVLGVLALIALAFPGWSWIVGGVLGLAAIAVGTIAIKGSRTLLAGAGLIAGIIAAVVAAVTAVFVYGLL